MFRYWIFDAVPAVVLSEFIFRKESAFGIGYWENSEYWENSKHHIEKITTKNEVWDVSSVQMSRKKTELIQELFPIHPTYQNPIFLNPRPLLCKVSWIFGFSVFWPIGPLLAPYCTPFWTPTASAVRKDETLTRIRCILGSKTGIRFDTKWHHNWPN